MRKSRKPASDEIEDLEVGCVWAFPHTEQDGVKEFHPAARFPDGEIRFACQPSDPRKNVTFPTLKEAQQYVEFELLKYTADEIRDVLTISVAERMALRTRAEIARDKIEEARRKRRHEQHAAERRDLGWESW